MMHSVDAVHGLYYAIMHFWIGAFGTSNFALRLPSILAVGLACAGVAVLGARLGNRSIAILSAVAFLLLPRVTWMGIEARSFALTATVAVWLTIILLRAIDRRRTGMWVAYALLAGIAVTLNVYLALLVVAHGVSLLLARRRVTDFHRLLLGWIIAAGAGVVLALPVMLLVVTQTGQLPFGSLTLDDVANMLFIEQYFTGATPTVARSVPIPPTSMWATASIVLAAIGWCLIVLPVVWHRIVPAPTKRTPLGMLTLLVPWIAIPTAVVIGYSVFVTPMYTGRYFSFTTPAVALLIGVSLAALARRWQRVVVVALLVLIAVPIFLSQREPTAKNGSDWEQVASVIATHARPGQEIYYGRVRGITNASMSKVRDAYPAVLSRLNDITLKRTGAQNGQLWDSQWPVAHAASEVHTTSLLWVVVQHYGFPKMSTAKQLRYFEAAGLSVREKWVSSATDVYLLTR
jgi:mannosyltransferase